ncbi:alpha/beta-hydrolase, partial [Panus rudis PR-1116 ss-1]
VSPRNPLVFCHGLMGFDTISIGPSSMAMQISHWPGIKDALEANGIEVLITRVPATSSPIDRAKILVEQIDARFAGRAVHLIGRGGLDCRYLITHLKTRRFRVLSLTTISCPHHGSSMVDYLFTALGRKRMQTVSSLLNWLPIGDGDGNAFEFLTTTNMRRFNEETPNDPDVKYFSWGAMYEPGLLDPWRWSHSIIKENEGPNDGVVSVQSAHWGTYLGTLEDVGHSNLTGWVNTARHKWAQVMGREVKFKPTTFYLGIADHLARVVEENDNAP